MDYMEDKAAVREWARLGAVAQLEAMAKRIREAFPEMRVIVTLSAESAPAEVIERVRKYQPAPAPKRKTATKTAAAPKPATKVNGKARHHSPATKRRLAKQAKARWAAIKAKGGTSLADAPAIH